MVVTLDARPPRFLELAGHPLRWQLLSDLARSDRRVGELCELAAHPLRWQLLSDLARSDRRVGELCELAGQPQNLVSYHLRRLRDGGLVSARHSSADGRDTYYALDLDRCH